MLYIDDRVGAVELAQLLPKRKVAITRLQYADVRFVGNGPPDDTPVSIGIERKTITDLVSSIHSGRLSGHQVLGLLNSYDYVYVVVEGLWRPGPSGLLQQWRKGHWVTLRDYGGRGRSGLVAREITNYLNTLTLMRGIRVWRTNTPQETAQWLLDLHAWWGKRWGQHKSHHQFNGDAVGLSGVLLRRPGLVMRIAKELDGVGWEKARAIAERYSSVLELALADPDELREIPGIGKVLAHRISEQLQHA